MLITVPLCMSVFIGSRQLDEEGRGMSEYVPVSKGSSKLVLKPVVPTKLNIFANGATALPSTMKGAKWMLATCSTYLFIQIPAFFYSADDDGGASHETIFAFAGCIASAVLFFAYLYSMWDDVDNLDMIEERRQRVHKFMLWSQQNRTLIGTLDPVTLFNLLDKDQDGMLDAEDLRLGFKTMGLVLSHAEAQAFFNMMKNDNNRDVDIGEFVSFVKEFILSNESGGGYESNVGVPISSGNSSTTPVMQAVKDRILREHRVRRESFSLDPNAVAKMGLVGPMTGMKTRSRSSSQYAYQQGPGLESDHGLSENHSFEASTHGHANGNGTITLSEKSSLLPGTSGTSTTVSSPLSSNTQSKAGTSTRSSYASALNTDYGARYGTIPSYAQRDVEDEIVGSGSGSGKSNSGFPSVSSAWNVTSSSGSIDGKNEVESGHSSSPTSYSRNATIDSDMNQFNSSGRPTNAASARHEMGMGLGMVPPIANPGDAREVVVDIYTDPNRREEPIERNAPAPPLPPELMQLLIKWFVDPSRTESVLIRVGTKQRWALHLWAARTGRLMHYSTTDPYTNERVLKLCKISPSTLLHSHGTTVPTKSSNSNHISDHSITVVGRGGKPTLSRTSSTASTVGVSRLQRQISAASATVPDNAMNNNSTNSVHDDEVTIANRRGFATRMGSFDRVWVDTDLPRWASASDEILHFVRQRPGCSVQTIFAEADVEGRGSVTLTNLLSFAAQFGLNIPSNAIKILFFANDADHDRALTVTDFKHFLESLVHVPEEFEQLDRMMRDAEDDALERELELAGMGAAVDPAHAHMQGWSEQRKKLYGVGLLVVSIAVVAFFSDPMIEVIGAFSVNIAVKPFYVSFVVTPFVSNASEVIASLMFARAKTNVSMGLTLSSLYGAVTMNNTFCMCIFLALIGFRGLAWRYTAEVLTIITVEFIVAFICMRETLRQWQALIIGSLFPLSILMVYVLEEVWHINS